jgi:predicted GIY-YIG superfamily endonuclease
MLTLELPSFYREYTSGETKDIPKTGGIYYLYNCFKEVIYVGKATNLKNRLRSHLSGKSNTSLYFEEFSYIRVYPISDPAERDIYETYAINTLKPKHNKAKTFYKSIIEAIVIEKIIDIEEEVIFEDVINEKDIEFRLIYDKANEDFEKKYSYNRLHKTRKPCAKERKKIEIIMKTYPKEHKKYLMEKMNMMSKC